MNKLNCIYSLLITTKDKLHEKHVVMSNAIIKAKKNKDSSIKELELAHEHIKGQLYEVDYLIDSFWEIMQKNDL